MEGRIMRFMGTLSLSLGVHWIGVLEIGCENSSCECIDSFE